MKAAVEQIDREREKKRIAANKKTFFGEEGKNIF